MTLSRKKILILQPECHDRSHDANDLVGQMISAFPKEKYELTSAFVRGKKTKDHPASCADKIVYFDMPKRAMSGLRLRLRWSLYLFCRREKFDVVICNRYKLISMIMQLNRLLKIPVCIGVIHGLGDYRSRLRRVFSKRLVTLQWRFVGVSAAVKDYLLGLGCGFTDQNTVVIDNAIDVQATEAMHFSREEARRILELPIHARVFGSIGRLATVKGYVYLIRAFAQISTKHPDTLLAIVGDGQQEAELLEEINRLGLKERVRLLGFRKQACRFVRAFDLWVMPSLSEGLPRSLLEGMSGHLPLITSDIPSLRPIVCKAGGLLVPPEDSVALAEALDSVLTLPSAEFKALGEEAYRYLIEHLSIDKYKQGYMLLVEGRLNRCIS